jgi:hypothetical protein
MTDIKTFLTETEKEKRLHKVEIKNEIGIPSIEYIDKNHQVPNELIKYYRADEFGYKVLKDAKVWASNPYLHFNDPFDCAIQMWKLEDFPIDIAINHLQNCGYRITSDDPPAIRKMYFEKVYQLFGIFSLNDRSKADLFWGYYNDHKGFSIEFAVDELSSMWGMKPLKVEYDRANNFEKLLLIPDEILNKNILSKIVRWSTLKKLDWKHENEWRFVFLDIIDNNQNETRLKPYPKKAIQQIILGYKFFSNIDYERINDWTTKYIFKDDFENNYSYKILKFLYDNTHIPLKQVALTENFHLFNQKIFIKEIIDDQVIIVRD